VSAVASNGDYQVPERQPVLAVCGIGQEHSSVTRIGVGMKRLRLRLFRAAPLSVLSTMAMAGLAGVGLASVGLGGMTGTARAAYIGSDGRIAYVRGGDIYSINPADPGAGSKLLAGGGRDSGPRWSPSGKKLAYIDDGNLWIMNANGSHKQQITRAAPRFTDGRPTWSPNGVTSRSCGPPCTPGSAT
jgi:hypothetical protein